MIGHCSNVGGRHSEGMVSKDIGYDGGEWRSRVSMERVISFDALLDVIDGYCDKVGSKVYVKDSNADVWVKDGGHQALKCLCAAREVPSVLDGVCS